MPILRFPTGAATSRGALVVIGVQRDDGSAVAGSLYADYQFAADADCFGTPWSAIGICFHPDENTAYAAGENGEVIHITQSGHAAEYIDFGSNGPQAHGPIRDVRVVGEAVYAVGMGRQVYRRATAQRWERFDDGILDTSGRLTCGLVGIAAGIDGGLTSVGYDGEIWEFAGTWTQADSPTNVLLTRVVVHAAKTYASGLVGTLLCREAAGWRAIDTAGFSDDIWDIHSFRGVLYLGTSRGLWWLSPQEEIRPVDAAGFTRQKQCTSLSSFGDRLWCFGDDIISSTVDGKIWREEILF